MMAELSPSKSAKGKGRPEDNEPLIYSNSSSAYIANNARATQTSNNVFSSLLVPLSVEEFNAYISSANATKKHTAEIAALQEAHKKVFTRYLSEMLLGFNLLFYGLGSKRTILNKFAQDCCALQGDVVVVNGFIPQCSIKDVLTSIERVPGLADKPSMGGLDGQVKRIYEWYAPTPDSSEHQPRRPLFLLIHNLDATTFLAPKARSILSMLAMSPRIHLMGSIDRMGATPPWTSSELASRKHIPPFKAEMGEEIESPGSRGFAWLWHDLTTMEAYTAELSFIDPTTINGAAGGGSGAGAAGPNGLAGGGGAMTESAAHHILAAVTVKAKKLFLLLASRQLEMIDDMTSTVTGENMAQYAIPRDVLFHAARDDFIATNETAMSALLGEFRDHGLMRSQSEGAGAGESLWIPLRKEVLKKLADSIEV